MNTGMLTMPTNWIDNIVYKVDNDLLKQIILMI